MSTAAICPVCGSRDVTSIARFPRSVTSDSVIADAPVDNLYCRACGLVSNACGARGQESKFYSDDYNLLGEAGDAEFVYETDAGLQGINSETVDFLAKSLSLPDRGSILDVGCGKGLLLRAFRSRFPEWRLHGAEPSQHARAFLGRVLPDATVHGGMLESSPFAAAQFDLVTCTGVLEHVPDPVAFSRSLATLIGDKGRLFVSVPNLANNPIDLITFDHLNRFTPDSLVHVLSRANLRVEAMRTDRRVPMWVLARRGAVIDPPIDPPAVAYASADWFERALAVYRELGRSSNDRRIGIYGTGLIAMAAVALGCIRADAIVAFFDDNPHFRGSSRMGRPVRALQEANSLGITDITFSANPVYIERMTAKVRDIGPGPRIWPLPA